VLRETDVRSESQVLACPLCSHEDGQVVATLSYGDIWRALEAEQAARFDEDVIRRHTPAAETSLICCSHCGLQYFCPCIAGTSEFYEQLTGERYYEEDRWEFGEVAALIGSDVAAVVDFGCGRGDFLAKLETDDRRLVGVDHNRQAIARLEARGIEGHCASFSEFAEAHRDAFDVASCFQIAEHLPRIDDVLGPAVRCVRPGGRVFISVPNSQRVSKASFEPLDCPPHHVSRWLPAQFEPLARQYGLELISVRFEPPSYWWVRDVATSHAEAAVPAAFGPRVARSAGWLGRNLRATRRSYSRRVRRGEYARRGLHGHTMLGELRRPVGSR
jgi:SAM-dependent methyltransferase